MADNDFSLFLQRVAALGLSNKAMIACMSAGIELTPENVLPVVRRLLDENNPHFDDVLVWAEGHRADVVGLAAEIRR